MPTYDIGLEHVSLAFATKTIFTDVTQGVFEGDLVHPIAMEEGLRFAIREGGHTVGSGIVSTIIE